LRTLIVAAAALLFAGATSPTLAMPLPGSAAGSAELARAATALDPASHVMATKKKKKKSSKKESVSFQEIGNARRGKSDLEIKVKTSKADRTCQLKIKWHDGSTTNEEEDSDDDKICEFTVSVPSGRDAAGDAEATVTVKDGSGKKVASAKKKFPVS
jgi:hypothetical protein